MIVVPEPRVLRIAQGRMRLKRRGRFGIMIPDFNPQSARAVANVLYECFDDWQSSLVSISFFGLFDSSEAASRCALCFLGAHSPSEILLDEHFEMRSQLVVEIFITAIPSKESANPRPDLSKLTHLVS